LKEDDAVKNFLPDSCYSSKKTSFTWKNYTIADDNYNLLNNGQGVFQLVLQLTDVAENVRSVALDYYVIGDMKAPAVNCSATGTKGDKTVAAAKDAYPVLNNPNWSVIYTNDENAKISLSVSDYGSGVKSVKYAVVRADDIEFSNEMENRAENASYTDITVPFNGIPDLTAYCDKEGIYQLFLLVEDNVSNKAIVDYRIYMVYKEPPYTGDDSTPPELTFASFKKYDSSNNETDIELTNLMNYAGSTPTLMDASTYNKLYLKDSKFIVHGTVSDEEAGPATVNLKLFQLQSETGTKQYSNIDTSKMTDYEEALITVPCKITKNGDFTAVFDLSELEDGVYAIISITATDRAGNECNEVTLYEIDTSDISKMNLLLVVVDKN